LTFRRHLAHRRRIAEDGMAQGRDEPHAEVAILMGLYHGEAFLPQQLDSLLAQDHGAWSLTASDDSETPESAALVRAFARDHPERSVALRRGPRRGFVRNFLTLLERAPRDAPYLAFADQDDRWFADKLSRAVAALSGVPPTAPALYMAATEICDADLRVLGRSARFARPPTFRNALVQSIGGANTMVMNRAAADLASDLAATVPDPASHDWWLYQVVSGCGGTVLFDPAPVMSYRQHGRNLVGANISAGARLDRLRRLLGGEFAALNARSLAAIAPVEARFTPDARAAAAAFRDARQGPWWRRLAALRRAGVYRQGRADTAALHLACLLGRL